MHARPNSVGATAHIGGPDSENSVVCLDVMPADRQPEPDAKTIRTICTTRSRVNFFMNKFRKLGLIEYNGSLKVNSSLLGIVLHD